MLLKKEKYNTNGLSPEEMLGIGLVGGGLGGMYIGGQLEKARNYVRRKADPIEYNELQVVAPYNKRYIAANFQYNEYAPLIDYNQQNLMKYKRFSNGNRLARFGQVIPTSTSEQKDSYKPRETGSIENPFGQKDMFSEITNAITSGDATKLRAQKSYIEKQKKEGKITCDDYDFYIQKINENISNLEKSNKPAESKGKQHFVSADKVYYN